IEETRDSYFGVFLSLLEAIPDTLIYIENFEKIDASSMFILEQLFEHFEELGVSYLISYDKDFELHKQAHFLLARPYYTEITLKPSSFQEIIASDINFYKNIMTDFYFQRIAKYACGSTLFLDFAIQYLLECGVYSYTEYSIVMVNPKTIIIPSSLSQLIKRRLNLLKDDARALKFLAMAVLLGTRIDTKTIDSFGFANWKTIADKLAEMGYIYFYNDCMYFSNYTLLRENILEVIKDEDLNLLSNDLFNIAFVDNMPNPVKAFLYEQSQNHEKVIFEWEKLANINLSMGDFASYLNCSAQIVKCLEKYSAQWSGDELAKYKETLYSNISNNMFEYNPEETREIAEKTLTNLLKTENISSYIELCTKMVQGAMYHGEYLYALNLTHKVLSLMENVSMNPTAPNFDLNFLIMSVIHVKILFNIGAFNDCLDIGYNVLNVLDTQKIDNIIYKSISKEEFRELVKECIACIAIANVVSLNEDVREFLDISSKLFNFIPQEYNIFVELQNFIQGKNVSVSEHLAGNNIYTITLYHIIKAFISFKNKPKEFAKEIYKAKLMARETGLYSFELFADLLIGYSYANLGQFKKSSSILYKVVTEAKEKGLNAVMHIGWYIMSILNLNQGKIDIAYGILNNSDIQMEKNGGISDYLVMLNKVNMYKVLTYASEQDKAQICMNQATQIVQKYGLNFNLNIDIQKIMIDNQVSSRVSVQTQTAEMPQPKEESLSERKNIQTSSEIDEGDGNMINPEDFFSS
ncbi:hypothetical protein HDR58_07085, partial [bacterium]|nr:hypothetical protein [bacterium]